MHSCSECSPRIDMDHHFITVFRLYFLPGWDDQNVIHIELMKILLPVIYPVHILCLRLFDRTRPHVQIGCHIL